MIDNSSSPHRYSHQAVDSFAFTTLSTSLLIPPTATLATWPTPLSNSNSNSTFLHLVQRKTGPPCNAPLVPWFPLNPQAKDHDLLLDGRVCVHNQCCVSCDEYQKMGQQLERLHECVSVCSYIMFFCSFFVLVSHTVSHRFTVNTYAGIQAISFILMCGVMSFGTSVGSKHDKQFAMCYDTITPNTGLNSSRCMAQCVVWVLGLHMVTLSICARVLAGTCRVVFNIKVSKFVICVLVLGISGIFTGLASDAATYTGDRACFPSREASLYVLKIPLVTYSLIGILLVIVLSVFVTNSLYNISLNVLRSRTGSGTAIGIMSKLKLAVLAYFKSLGLVWRKYICAIYLLTIALSRLVYSDKDDPNDRTDGIAGHAWAECVYHRGADACQDLRGASSAWKSRVYAMTMMCVVMLIFPITEIRPIMFRGWWELLQTPSAIFHRAKSDKLLEKLIADKRHELRLSPAVISFQLNKRRHHETTTTGKLGKWFTRTFWWCCNTTGHDEQKQLDKQLQSRRMTQTTLTSSSYSHKSNDPFVARPVTKQPPGPQLPPQAAFKDFGSHAAAHHPSSSTSSSEAKGPTTPVPTTTSPLFNKAYMDTSSILTRGMLFDEDDHDEEQPRKASVSSARSIASYPLDPVVRILEEMQGDHAESNGGNSAQQSRMNTTAQNSSDEDNDNDKGDGNDMDIMEFLARNA